MEDEDKEEVVEKGLSIDRQFSQKQLVPPKKNRKEENIRFLLCIQI